MESSRRRIELRFEVVRNRFEGSGLQMAVGVAELARILLPRAVKRRSKIYIVQIRGESALPIVVIDRALIEHRVTDTQIEQAGIAAAGNFHDRGIACVS